MSEASMTRPSERSAFERAATTAWRSVRRFLPKPVAEAIRKPSKRALAADGLIRKS